MNLDIVKVEIDTEDESPKVSSTQWFQNYDFNRELKIILERCDANEKSIASNEGEIFICPVDYCKKLFYQAKCLKRHVRACHEKNGTCHICGKKVSHVERHLLRCTKQVPRNYACTVPDCGSAFFSNQDLKAHLKYVHEKYRHTCDICGSRVVHMSSHLERCLNDGRKKFGCEIEDCDATFSLKSNMKSHMNKVHRDPVKCPHQGCNTYVKAANISKHIRFTHDKSSSVCKNCGKTRLYLTQHMSICGSRGEKKYSCSFDGCKASFVIKKYLTRHLNTTHAERVKCPREDCNAFIKPACLTSHLKHMHENVVIKSEYCESL